MIYFVDGYNLLFKFFNDEKSIENERRIIIDFLNEKANLLNIHIYLVFDGHKQKNTFYNYSYYNNLKVIYTTKGQTADDYILEQIFLSKHPKKITVVSSDNALISKARIMQSLSKSIDSFLDFLSKKEDHIKKTDAENEEIEDSSWNIQRLVKIFEDKLKDENFDWH